jgi:uncharacterized protein (TIGR03437 family)
MRTFAFVALLSAATCFGQNASVVRILETDRGAVRYTIDGPFAVTEGDIILGRAAEIENYRVQRQRGGHGAMPNSLTAIFGTSGSQIWPGATSYYTIDADVPNQQAILDGIAYWNTHTAFKILPRSSEPNYIRFQHINIDAACNSFIGMVGGEQILGVTNNCPTGSVIHELGHSWGLWHEQQRTDRNGDLTVLYQNIDKRFIGNFPQAASAADTGYYDFDSIMHYPATGFSRNYLDALDTVPAGIPIGQRAVLSAGDIDGVSRLYKMQITSTAITTTPAGLNVTVDGVTGVAPQSFAWAPGSQHTVTADAVQGPEPRYVFARWSDGGGLAHTITASSAVTAFSVEFVRQHSLATGVSSGRGSVSVFPAPTDSFVSERIPLRITATPAAGSQFVRWVGSTALSSTGQGISSNPANVEMQSGPASYQAVFTTGALTVIDSKPRGAAILVDGTSYLTPANFAFNAGTTHTLGFAASQLYGNSTMRLQFTSWEDGSTGTRTITASAANTTYTAAFGQQFLLSTSVSGLGTVTASPASSDGFYDAGTTVHLTATPGPAQTLRFWLGDVAGGSLSSDVVMDQQRDTTTYFGNPLTLRVLNAASFLSTSNVASSATLVSAGEVLAIFGSNLGPSAGVPAAVGSDGKFPFTLGGTAVTFDGVAAPLIYVSDKQLDVIVPYAVAGKTSSVLKIVSSTATTSLAVGVAATAPALFTYDGSGAGQLAALNQDGSVNSPSQPAAPGSVVVLFATGGGAFDKTFPDGLVLGSDLGKPLAPVWVRFGKLAGDVLYAGTAPSEVNGVLQVNVRIPADLIVDGPVPVQLLVGTAGSQTGATISVASSN